MENNRLDYLILSVVVLFILTVILPLCGCEECESGEIQCDGDFITVCVNEAWQDRSDCSFYNDKEGFEEEGPWTCCDYGLTAYCVQERACKEVNVYSE